MEELPGLVAGFARTLLRFPCRPRRYLVTVRRAWGAVVQWFPFHVPLFVLFPAVAAAPIRIAHHHQFAGHWMSLRYIIIKYNATCKETRPGAKKYVNLE